MKIGRNEACPCGSGKKYKRCCLAQDERRSGEAAADGRVEPPHCAECGHEVHGSGQVALLMDDDLDELSNQIPDMIRAGRLAEAEALGLELLKRYPDQVDGLERLADVYEAQGELSKAIDYFRRAAAFVTLTPGFDPGLAQDYSGAASRLERQLKH